MSARLTCFTVALAAVAALSVSSPAKATEICDQQFKQCINKGTPTFKCEELRQLCESMYNARPQQQLFPSDRAVARQQSGSDATLAAWSRVSPAAP